MVMAPFSQFVDPQLAFDECRFIFFKEEPAALPNPAPPPNGPYALIEYYCCTPACDCRRMVLQLVEQNHGKVLASIGYGFDRDGLLPGPYLDPILPQSEFAEDVLDLVAGVLEDPEYVARCERHYNMVRERVNAPAGRRWMSQAAHRSIADIKAERKQRRKADNRRQSKGRRKPH